MDKITDLPDDKLESALDRGLRHRSGVTPDAYLAHFLAVARQFAYATYDDSWGEFEKEFGHIVKRLVRAERAQVASVSAPFEPRRRVLPSRRPGVSFKVLHAAQSGAVHHFQVTVGLYDRDGSEVGEVFINTEGRTGSDNDVLVSDAAIAVSLALQFGCPLETLRAAMKRNHDGAPMGFLSHVLDAVAATMGRE